MCYSSYFIILLPRANFPAPFIMPLPSLHPLILVRRSSLHHPIGSVLHDTWGRPLPRTAGPSGDICEDPCTDPAGTRLWCVSVLRAVLVRLSRFVFVNSPMLLVGPLPALSSFWSSQITRSTESFLLCLIVIRSVAQNAGVTSYIRLVDGVVLSALIRCK